MMGKPVVRLTAQIILVRLLRVSNHAILLFHDLLLSALVKEEGFLLLFQST